MTSFRLFALSAAVLACASIGFAAPEYVANETLVKFKPNTANQLTLAAATVGGNVVRVNTKINWACVRLNPGVSPTTAISSFKRLNFVVNATRNNIRRVAEVPNDPMIGSQWQINRVSLPQAWDLTHGSSDVLIAICDTGVQLNHPDLQAKIDPNGWDFINNDNDATDDFGHGTHVAGLAAAVTNNATGVAGTGYDCRILPVKVLSEFGSGSSQNVADGITWAADHGANVINLSLGSSGSAQVEQDAVAYAQANNVLVVAAAGNNNSTQKFYPAALPGVLAVASSDPDDSKSGFSNYGTWVHVAAPGNNVLATLMGGGYGNNSGTSMACPVTAGVCGLVFARMGSSATATEVFDIITNNCDTAPGNYVIFGRINAYESVRHALITLQTHLTVLSAQMFVGLQENGSLTDLESPDGIYYTVTTEVLGRAGSQGGLEFTCQIDRPAEELFDYQLNFVCKSSLKSTGMVWLFNQNTQNWDFIKAFPIKTTDTTAALKVRNFGKYLDADGNVMVRFRGHNASGRIGGNLPFNVSVDFAELQASYQVQP